MTRKAITPPAWYNRTYSDHTTPIAKKSENIVKKSSHFPQHFENAKLIASSS
jgi:hypothetical protein